MSEHHLVFLTLELKYSSLTESKKERRYIGHVSCLAGRVTCLSLYVITAVATLRSLHICACLINCVLPQTSGVSYTDCMHDLYALAACMISGGIYRRVGALL